MATVFSAQKTNSLATPGVMNQANELGGRIRVAHGTYEASSLSSGDVIEMFNLPDGARLLTGSIAHDALGSGTTLSVGHGAHNTAAGVAVSAAAAAYKAAASSASAGKNDILATLALGSGSELDADGTGVPITVTLGGGAATGTVALTIMYAVD